MKNRIIYIVLSIVLMGGFYSCEDYLDVVPDRIGTLDNSFSDRYTSYNYLVTCYSYLPNFGSNSNPALIGDDEVWYPEFHDGYGFIQFAKGNQNITNPIFDYWDGENYAKALYKGIRVCNTFIDRIDDVYDLNQYEKDRWKAEAKFLKGFYHFYLTRMYGPIHVVKESIPVWEATNVITQERNHVDSGFSYIVKLLDEAMPYLPARISDPATELGRITKPIAAAIKAKVLVTAASPLFNGNPDYASFGNKDGSLLFSSEFDASKWDSAAVACKEAIDICHAAGAKLFDQEDLTVGVQFNDSIKLKLALRSRMTERWNVELLWATTHSMVSGLQNASQPRLYSLGATYDVQSKHAPTLRIAEQYYTKNGVPIREDKTWDYENRYKIAKGDIDHRYVIGEGEETAQLNFNREFRFYSDLSHDRALWFANGKILDQEDSWLLKNLEGEYSSIFGIMNYSVTGYWCKKIIHLENTIANGTTYMRTNYAFPIFRLADLYLLYAEALNESKDDPDAEVYEYIDYVRERAGLNGVEESWTNFSSNPDKPKTKAGMRSIIQQERMIEMAFEGQRMWDLRRWKLAKQYLNTPIRGWNVLKNTPEEYYRVRNIYNQSFSLRDYLWPIDETEIIKNPNLVQNPGW